MMGCVAASVQGLIKTSYRTSSLLFGRKWALVSILSRWCLETFSARGPISSAGQHHECRETEVLTACASPPLTPSPFEVPPASWSCSIFGVSPSSTGLSQEMQKVHSVRKTEMSKQYLSNGGIQVEVWLDLE